MDRRTLRVLALAALAVACGSSNNTASSGPGDAGPDVIAPGDDIGFDAGLDAPVSPADGAIDAPADAAQATHANGTVGAWQTLAPMPVPRANHCMAVASGYLVVIGGNYSSDGSFVDTAEVDVALLEPDGSLGAWQNAGSTPSPVNSCTSTANGSAILLVDGIYDDPTAGAQVWTATLSAQGTLGAWTSLGPLPGTERVLYSQAWMVGTTLYAMDPSVDRNLVATLHAGVGSSLGAWVEDDWVQGFRGHPEYAMVGSHLYTLGGYSAPDDAGNNDMLADVHGAVIGPDGHVGSPFATQSLPNPTGFGAAVGVDDYIFVVGGKAQIFANGIPDVYSSQVAADGTLGAWAQQLGLPQGRTDLSAAVAGDFLYVSGGGFDAGGLDTVYAARVRF